MRFSSAEFQISNIIILEITQVANILIQDLCRYKTNSANHALLFYSLIILMCTVIIMKVPISLDGLN